MTRVLLLNTNRTSTREEISLTDRVIGESYFSGLDLQYAGHFIAGGRVKLAASWLVPSDKIKAVMDRLQNKAAPDGYQTILDIRLNGRTSDSDAHFE